MALDNVVRNMAVILHRLQYVKELNSSFDLSSAEFDNG